MTSWFNGNIAGFDLETTGKDTKEARIVTASLLLYSYDGKLINTLELLANPEVEIPQEASDVHGITTEYAWEHGLDITDVLQQLVFALDSIFSQNIPIVAYNGNYDFTVLVNECKRHDVKPPQKIAPVIDPFVIDKKVDKYRKGKRTLTDTCAVYNVLLDDAHQSQADAVAAINLAIAIGQKYSNELDMPLEKLHDAQKKWKAEDAESFENYLKSQGKFKETISRDWPFTP